MSRVVSPLCRAVAASGIALAMLVPLGTSPAQAQFSSASCPVPTSGSTNPAGESVTLLDNPSTNTFVYLYRPAATATPEVWICFRTPSAPTSPDGILILRAPRIPDVTPTAPNPVCEEAFDLNLADVVTIGVRFTVKTFVVCLRVQNLPGVAVAVSDPFPQPQYNLELWLDGQIPIQVGIPQ